MCIRDVINLSLTALQVIALAGLMSCLAACDDETTGAADITDAMNAGEQPEVMMGGSTVDGQVSDISDAVFTRTDSSCSSYEGVYSSSALDQNRMMTLTGTLTITADENTCTLTSNSVPNHTFHDQGSFATDPAEVSESFTISAAPTMAASATAISLQIDNAIMLNGVKLDLLAAACYGVGNEPLGREKIGCNQSETPWRYDPMFSGNNFGTDSHNAHTQPDGAYHYHGDPRAMYDLSGMTASAVIGFAADGYPIYGPYIDDGGSIRRVTSSYQLKSGMRESVSGEGAFPGGVHDGTYIDDYEYQAGVGDLDECNGMIRDGAYGYYVTDAYPWVLKCFKGTPDPSFNKRPTTRD